MKINSNPPDFAPRHKIIDMHCDTLLGCLRNPEEDLRSGRRHLNLEMMKSAGALAQFFAIYIARKEMEQLSPWEIFQRMYDRYQRELLKNPDLIRPAYSYEDILKNDGDGLMSSILTIEDATLLDADLVKLDCVYEMGVRLITLLWGYPNSLGYPCEDDADKNAKGLTEFGFGAVARMNELGIIVDVSHLSEGGFYDVARIAKKPFVASHSCAKALCSHKRNLTDDQLRILGNAGGVVGINFESSFLADGSRFGTMDQVLEHLDHMIQKAGIEHVGMGSDFDGIDTAGEIENYAGFERLAERLEERYSHEDVEKLMHKNVLRLIRDTL